MGLHKEELKHLGEEGLIPGPDETDEAFVERIDILKKSSHPFFEGKTFEKWDPNYSDLLGAKPDWIPLNFSNKKLLPWQGGVMWALDGKVPMIQLRKGFKKGRFLMYSKEEVLLHETVHALRLSFNEPQFEEILAYYLSDSKWRKWFGPLFRSPNQALFFVSLVLLSLVIQVAPFFLLSSFIFPYIQWMTFLPFADLLLRFAILVKDHRTLKKTLKNLSKIFPRQKNVFPIAVRLKDSEIQMFGIEEMEKSLEYIEKIAPKSLRWQQILAQFC